MKKNDILKSIESIRRQAGDKESMHSDEDALYKAFIKYVAERKDSLGEKARLVLSINDTNPERWYA